MNGSLLRRRCGLSLLEVVISLILVSTIMLVSITASANLLRSRVESLQSVDGHELAFQMLDEVTSVAFEDADSDRVFGRESSETSTTRSDFDDVDDYHGYTVSPPTHRSGAAIAGWESWSVSIAVSRAQAVSAGIVASNSDDAPLRLVTVTCTSPSGSTLSESMLISAVSSDIPPNTSYEKTRRLTLKFANHRSIDLTVPLRNQPDWTTNR